MRRASEEGQANAVCQSQSRVKQGAHTREGPAAVMEGWLHTWGLIK